MERNQIKQILGQHGLKVSEQRIMILDFLYETQTHPTADEIFQTLNQSDPILSRATVYNTLKTFVETGVIQALEMRDNETRYDAALHEHGHFRCKHCKKIYNVAIKPDLLEMELPGFIIEDHSVTLRGVCPDCATNQT